MHAETSFRIDDHIALPPLLWIILHFLHTWQFAWLGIDAEHFGVGHFGDCSLRRPLWISKD